MLQQAQSVPVERGGWGEDAVGRRRQAGAETTELAASRSPA